jgi:hypothetical protein
MNNGKTDSLVTSITFVVISFLPVANINRVQLLLHFSINLFVLVGLSDSYIPLDLKYNL